MSDSQTMQEMDSMTRESPEGLGSSWIDNAVTESHDADDAPYAKSAGETPEDSHPRRQASGAAIASVVRNDTLYCSSYQDVLTRVPLQAIDREAAAKVFRTAPVPPSQAKSDAPECTGRGGSASPNGQDRGADSFLEEFSSVVQRLADGVRLDADGEPASAGGFAANQGRAETQLMARSGPTQVSLQLHGDNSDLTLTATSSTPAPRATLKKAPEPATAASANAVGKRKRPTCGASDIAGKKKKTARRKTIESSAVSIAAMSAPTSSEAPSVERSTTGAGPIVDIPSARKNGRASASETAKQGEWKLTQPSSAVGPRSVQMQVVIRMTNYIIQTFTDTKLVRQVVDAVMHCTEEHQKGVRGSFAHLPGAIFDHMVDLLDPNEVIRVFNLCKWAVPDVPVTAPASELVLPNYYLQFQPSSKGSESKSVNDESRSNPSASDGEFVSNARLDSTPDVLATTPVNPFSMADHEYIPDLLEAAVGYGFHLASLHPNSMDVDFHTFLTQGASTVLDMNLTDRRLLWKYLMSKESRSPPLHQHPRSGNPPNYAGTLSSSPQASSQAQEPAGVSETSPDEEDASHAIEV